MGIILSGILGGFSGKVGPVIGGNWKGIDYMKQYFKPSNPQSTAQTSQRNKFKTVSKLASDLLGSLIATYRNPFAVKMSGYNYFIKDFIKDASSTGLATVNCLVVNGTINPLQSVTSDYNNSSGDLETGWSDVPTGNQLGSDYGYVMVINKTNNEVIKEPTLVDTLDAGGGNITIPTGLSAADLICYAWLSRGSGADFLVSDSVGVQVGAV